MPPPEPPGACDVLLVESTYGNRLHPHEDGPELLGAIVRAAAARGGSVVLPAFPVGRAQALLLVLQRLRRAGLIPRELPIFLDSPMAAEATALYRKHARLLRVAAREMSGLLDGVRVVADAAQSIRLSNARFPRIIISASGMATGGRVLHHLKALAPDARNTIVFAGFQVGGSRGARLVAGEREIKIHGEMVPVRAAVRQLEGFSGHADRDEILDWLKALKRSPERTFVVHGEPDASDALRSALQDRLGWRGVGVAAGFFLVMMMGRLDPRVTMIIGFGVQIVSGVWLMAINLDVDFVPFALNAFLQGVAVGLIWAPIATTAFWTLPTASRAEAASMFHLTRNIASSFFISICVAEIVRSTGINYSRMAENVSSYNPSLALPWVMGAWDPTSLQGLQKISNEIARQSALIAYLNAFGMFTAACAVTIPLILLIGSGRPRAVRAASS